MTINPQGPGEVLAGGGDMGALMRAFDWSTTPLGPPERWPASLRTAVRIMLTSRQPIWIGWGPQLTYLYNDPYKSIIGGKHPWALGRPTAEVWSEIRSDIEPLLATAMGGDEGIYVEEQLLIMERNGYPEETYYTFSYSPVPDDDGTVGGIICANTDDTPRVIGERQLALLRDLATQTAPARDAAEAVTLAVDALAGNPHDLPFAMVYTAAGADAPFVLAGASPSWAGEPAQLPFDEAASSVGEALNGRAATLVEPLGRYLAGALPRGAWSQPPTRGLLLPIPLGEGSGAALLLVGLNPFRALDDGYRSFLELVAGQIGAAIGNAEAYERERRRAEALAELDRAKTQFFSNVSHEFRTPLTLMLGPLEEVLQKGPDEVLPANRMLVELAHRNGLRLMRMVNTLLDFSRLEAGRTQARFAATDLAAFTRELAGSFADAAARAGLSLTVDAPPLAAPAFVDRAMWETIVLNLLSNAFKFTFEGGITVRLAQAGDTIRLTVADTGTGIPADELPRLFDRFHRVAGARGRSFEGSGVGLALVQELSRLHGGGVTVESDEGHGSRFHVDLPAGAAHLPADRIDAQAPATAAPLRTDTFLDEALRWLPGGETVEEAPVGGAAGRVVLADDNADMRDYVRRMLEQSGYAVRAVGDGHAALAALRDEPADLLLSDVMMPGLDGFGLLAALRADPVLREMPVVMLSARAGEEAKVEGLEAGADDYLVKPFSGRELVARVAANIGMARVRRDARVALAQESRILATLNRTGAAVAAELELDPLVQMVTDAGVELTGAAFGAFFYSAAPDGEEKMILYTLSGAERADFDRFPLPRSTAVFAPTFAGESVVRSDDILVDPRYGQSGPHHGMPAGHLPVRSYLAVPVRSRSGEVIGGLFFGHPEPGRFGERHEQLVVGLAAQSAVAMDNARLFSRAQREIASRRDAEARLRDLNTSLEARVAEEVGRRAEAEEALRQAQKMEAVGQLTGGIAHDFNNLLTVVTGNIDMAGRALTAAGVEDARARRALANAMKGADRATSLTQRLLAFSRRQPLAPKATDVDRLVAGMSELLHRALGETVRLEIVTSPGLWRVEVDQNQLESAILNLAVNARDAMPNGGRLLIETANATLDESHSAAQAEVAPGQYVMLCVTDTGQGMDRTTVTRVFEPFFTTKEVGKGTGLGLSMVYGFVKQSGGHVKLYSEEGAGTAVKIYLPRLMSDAAADDEPAVEHGAQGSANAETILVVEDDDDVRAYTVECLRELGYRVLEAHDGTSALRLFERRDAPVDLLFTDVVMPGMNGSELVTLLRERQPGLNVLYTSGYTRNAIVHGGRLDAGVEMIAKPFSHAALARKVREMLDAGGAGRVLLVQGDADARGACAAMLGAAGFAVEQAAIGGEALGKVRAAQGRYDVVAIDLGGGAATVVAELRALHARLPLLIAGDPATAERYAADACIEVVAAFDANLTAVLRRQSRSCRMAG